MASRYFLGVDGGGSSTRALLADESGQVVGRGQAGPANPNVVGTDAMLKALGQAVAEACRAASLTPGSLTVAFFGVAGVASAPDRETFPKRLAEIPELGGAIIVVDHDLRIAHAACLGAKPGIILIAGTGSAGFARDASGTERICGGGGPLIDDVGSGFWLVMQALKAAFASAENRRPPTRLLPALCAKLQARHHRELAVAATKSTRDALAALAPVVFAAAEEGDAVAAEILEEGARELSLIAGSLQHSLFPEGPVPLGLCGGLSQVSGYRERLKKQAAARSANFLFQETQREPVEGALFLAAQRAGLASFSEKFDSKRTTP